MKRNLILFILVIFLFFSLLIAQGKQKSKVQKNSIIPGYLCNYQELYQKDPHAAALQWFKDAKFGLFIHYALASLLPEGKWEYIQLLEKKGEEVNNELFKKFTAEKFDADFIADLAVSAGMKYITFTTQHLGRMFMFKTSLSDFSSVNSPAKRDLVAELAEACRKRNLGLFLYVPPERARTDSIYFKENRTVLKELLTNYGPIAGIWFDGINGFYKNPQNYSRLAENFAFIRSLQPQCLISFKEGALGEEDFITPEHFLLPTPVKWDTELRQERWEIRLERWTKNNKERWEKYFKYKPAEINTTMQICLGRDGIGRRGGWINDEATRHLEANEAWFLLKVARSLKANLLLNIGLRGDGSVHPADIRVLRKIGKRIRKHGFPE